MVRTSTNTQTVINLYERNTNVEYRNGGNCIEINSDFQRGDEETGVWNTEYKQKFIDSLQNSFPTGIITVVKDYKCATAYQDPWKVLDGGNRMRSIRDYIDDKFVDLNGKKYSQLTPDDRAAFKHILIPYQEITIERNDPDDTIADMFTRLNTQLNPLKNGELFKAHGHRGDIIEIEMAKKLVGDNWTSTFEDDDVLNIREIWTNTFGSMGETNRCDSLAMMIGYILSAKNSNFNLFDKRYKTLNRYLSRAGEQLTQNDYDCIYNKLRVFLDTLNSINDLSIFGRLKKGLPPQTKIAPLWKKICEGSFTDEDQYKFIEFYNSLDNDIALRNKYIELGKGTNGETGNRKIQSIVDFILSH